MAKQVILWSTPRCVSTAFERSIRTLQHVQVFHEAFGVPFYCGPQKGSDLFTSISCDPSATYQSVAEILMKNYEGKRLVFAKEMACCLNKNYHLFLQEGMKDFQHTFLIRSPDQVARSITNIYQYFLPKEFGVKTLFELYNFVVDNFHPSPVVIDAGDLLEFPDEIMRGYCEAIGVEYEEGMTTWTPGPVPGWDREVCEGWHDSVMKSSGFVKRKRSVEKPDMKDLPKEAIDLVEECLPMYEAMYAKRMLPKP